jgi:hypothetical protein
LERDGQLLNFDCQRFHHPECVHLGFASGGKARAAKHRYYEARGESRTRAMYVECRRAWERGQLPVGASVIPYTGPIPEVFRCS